MQFSRTLLKQGTGNGQRTQGLMGTKPQPHYYPFSPWSTLKQLPSFKEKIL